MKLSVIVPAFNATRYMAEAFESVLAQIPPDSEVLVIDDGSTDDTAAMAESFGAPVRVIRATHGGIAVAVNRGLAEAKGEWIASIDADDRWLPTKTALQFAALDENPSLDMVFGYVRQFLSPELAGTDTGRYSFSEEPIAGLHRGSMLIRREAWQRVGDYQTDLLVGEFIDWYARALDAGLKSRMLPDVVYERRLHGHNTVIRERDAYNDYVRVVKASLDRRRARAREVEESGQ